MRFDLVVGHAGSSGILVTSQSNDYAARVTILVAFCASHERRWNPTSTQICEPATVRGDDYGALAHNASGLIGTRGPAEGGRKVIRSTRNRPGTAPRRWAAIRGLLLCLR